jgi:hypothetical protein
MGKSINSQTKKLGYFFPLIFSLAEADFPREKLLRRATTITKREGSPWGHRYFIFTWGLLIPSGHFTISKWIKPI